LLEKTNNTLIFRVVSYKRDKKMKDYLLENYCDIEDPKLAFPRLDGKRVMASQWNAGDIDRLKPRLISRKRFETILESVEELYGKRYLECLETFSNKLTVKGEKRNRIYIWLDAEHWDDFDRFMAND
jgi:hypothetical protein